MGRSDERVWWVSLSAEPQLEAELALLRHRMRDADDVSLVLDLSRVEIINSCSLGTLLIRVSMAQQPPMLTVYHPVSNKGIP